MYSATKGKEKINNSQSLLTHFSGRERDMTGVEHNRGLKGFGNILFFQADGREFGICFIPHTHMRTPHTYTRST